MLRVAIARAGVWARTLASMPNRAAKEWVKTLILAAAIGVPITFLVLAMSLGLVHGGIIARFILIGGVPGLLVGDAGWPAVIAVQGIYYLLIAIIVRNTLAHWRGRKDKRHAS